MTRKMYISIDGNDDEELLGARISQPSLLVRIGQAKKKIADRGRRYSIWHRETDCHRDF